MPVCSWHSQVFVSQNRLYQIRHDLNTSKSEFPYTHCTAKPQITQWCHSLVHMSARSNQSATQISIAQPQVTDLPQFLLSPVSRYTTPRLDINAILILDSIIRFSIHMISTIILGCCSFLKIDGTVSCQSRICIPLMYWNVGTSNIPGRRIFWHQYFAIYIK